MQQVECCSYKVGCNTGFDDCPNTNALQMLRTRRHARSWQLQAVVQPTTFFGYCCLELLQMSPKVRLSTSSWHLAYGVAQQKSNMDAPAGCHKDHRKVLRHLTCSTCCCCGSSADEVKGYMQGHRGQDNHKCSKVQGLWAVLERFNHALSLHKLGDLVVAGVLPNAGAFANLDS